MTSQIDNGRLLVIAVVIWLAGNLLIPRGIQAQEFLGALFGNVQDVSGGAVVGATIKLNNQATGVTQTTTSRTDGAFVFLKLPPGSYAVEVTKAGFQKYTQTGLTIKAAVSQRLDVILQVGKLTQTVSVTANLKLVEPLSMERGGTMPASFLQNLPTLNLDWTNLSVLFPGAQQNPDRLGNSFNGARTTANDYLVNGVDASDPGLNAALVTPNPYAIQEFRLITSSMKPEYGGDSGSLMEVVTKSGTNQFHGSLFYFHRDKGLNARDFFQTVKPDYNRNTWGGTIGGPIRKEHTFFFFDLLAFKEKVPATASYPYTPNNPQVYSPAERGGDFSTTKPFSGVSPDVPPFNGQAWSTLFPGNQIDPIYFNSISKYYLENFIPQPNLPGNHFNSTGSSSNLQDRPGQWGLKIEQHNSADSISGSFFWRNSNQELPFPFAGANVPGFGQQSVTHVRQFSLSYTHSFGSNLINEARYGYSRLWYQAVEPDTTQPGNQPPSAFGFKGINPQDPAFAASPKIQVGGSLVLGFSNYGPQPRVDDTHQLTDNLSWIHGRHNLKFGIEYRHFRVYSRVFTQLNGAFTFNGAGRFSTGNAFADFLLGIPDSYSQGSGSTLDGRSDSWYVYAQDIFRVTPRLTLTYGLGWTLNVPWENLFNDKKSMIAFRPGCHSTIYPTAPIGICYTGDPGIPRGTAPLRKKDFDPRFGFAWTPDSNGGLLGWLIGGAGKFVIRGGYGVYRDTVMGESALQFTGNPPMGFNVSGAPSPSFSTPFTSVDGAIVRPNPFPASPAPPIGSSVNFAAYEPFYATSFDANFKNPFVQNYNLTIERQFGQNWLLRLGYVGSQGRNLLSTYEGNPVDSALAAQEGCPPLFTQYYCPSVTRFIPGNEVSSVVVQGSFANSSYNSFQAEVEKRVSRNLSLLLSYTLSKSLDNSNGLEGDNSSFQTVDPFNPGRDRALSEFDATHRLVLSYVWNLPGPKSGIGSRVLGGWRMSGITTFATGFPVFLTDTSDRCLIGEALIFFRTYCRPDLVGPIRKFNPRADVAVVQNLQNDQGVAPSNAYFDPTAFTRVPPNSGLLGTAPRDLFHGPGINNFDIGVQKDIDLYGEKVHVTPRVDFFNAWNHAQFRNPSGDVNSFAFGQVTSTRGPRIIQVGVNVTF